MPATRKTGVRVLALALACAPNAALFLLMWFSRAPETEEQPVFAMLWLTEPRPTEPLPAPSPDNEPRVASSVQLPLPVVPPAPDLPEQSTAITVPPIDWYAEGLRSARKEFPDNAREKPEPSLDSRPRGMALPDNSNEPHKFGDETHLEGGEILTWINESCYYSNRPTEPLTGGWHPPTLKLPTCMVRSLAERNSEKYAAELEKTLQEKYRRPSAPTPVPEPD